jgi:hypothetical protein
MPGEDREQNFEKALARGLRSSDAVPGNDCLDAETLAAYHERLLDPEEMAQRKAHIASCERCQEVLAQLEATDTIRVEADRDLMLDQVVLDIPETEPVGAVPEGQPQPAKSYSEVEDLTAAAPLSEELAESEAPAKSADPELESEIIRDHKLLHDPELVPTSAPAPLSAPAHAAAPETIALVSAAKSAKAAPSSATITFRSPREGRPKMVRYVAIAGALAAALILWFVYRDQSKDSTVALNQPAPKMELPPQSPAQPPQSGDKTATSPSSEANAPTSQSSAAPAAAQPQQAPSKSPTESLTNSLDDAQKTLDAAKSLEKKSRKDAAAQAPTFIPSGQDESAGALSYARANPRTAPGTGTRKPEPLNPVDKALADAKAVLQPAANSSSTSGIPATPPPARTKMIPGVVSDSAAAESAAAPSAKQKPATAPQELMSHASNGRVGASLTPLSVPAPSGTTIWRIGQAGMIQRSANSGATWSIQPSGVVTDLIAGSAYSDQICWLVGRNGTILRTTDGGATWQKLTSPSSVDLLSVFAINADSATITDAAGRAFETTSAGARWARTRIQPE